MSEKSAGPVQPTQFTNFLIWNLHFIDQSHALRDSDIISISVLLLLLWSFLCLEAQCLFFCADKCFFFRLFQPLPYLSRASSCLAPNASNSTLCWRRCRRAHARWSTFVSCSAALRSAMLGSGRCYSCRTTSAASCCAACRWLLRIGVRSLSE